MYMYRYIRSHVTVYRDFQILDWDKKNIRSFQVMMRLQYYTKNYMEDTQ